MSYKYRFGENRVPLITKVLYGIGVVLTTYQFFSIYPHFDLISSLSLYFLLFIMFLFTISIINMKRANLYMYNNHLRYKLLLHSKRVYFDDIARIEYRESHKHERGEVTPRMQTVRMIYLYDKAGKPLIHIAPRDIGGADEHMRFYRMILAFNPHIELNQKALDFMQKYKDRG